MAKTTSYQKLKTRISDLEKQLELVIEKPNSDLSIAIKVSHLMKKNVGKELLAGSVTNDGNFKGILGNTSETQLLPPDKIFLLKEVASSYIYETAEEGRYSIAAKGIEKVLEYYEIQKKLIESSL